MKKEIRTTKAERRKRENEITQLGMGKQCPLSHPNQGSVISYLMTFAAPTVLPTLEVDLMPVLSNCFSAETELGNTQCNEKYCYKSAMLKPQTVHAGMLYMQLCVGQRTWFRHIHIFCDSVHTHFSLPPKQPHRHGQTYTQKPERQEPHQTVFRFLNKNNSFQDDI